MSILPTHLTVSSLAPASQRLQPIAPPYVSAPEQAHKIVTLAARDLTFFSILP